MNPPWIAVAPSPPPPVVVVVAGSSTESRIIFCVVGVAFASSAVLFVRGALEKRRNSNSWGAEGSGISEVVDGCAAVCCSSSSLAA